MSGNAHALGFGVIGTQASHPSPSNPLSLTLAIPNATHHPSPSNPLSLTLPIPNATHHYTTSPLVQDPIPPASTKSMHPIYIQMASQH